MGNVFLLPTPPAVGYLHPGIPVCNTTAPALSLSLSFYSAYLRRTPSLQGAGGMSDRGFIFGELPPEERGRKGALENAGLTQEGRTLQIPSL
jgi:hypothetical protein